MKGRTSHAKNLFPNPCAPCHESKALRQGKRDRSGSCSGTAPAGNRDLRGLLVRGGESANRLSVSLLGGSRPEGHLAKLGVRWERACDRDRGSRDHFAQFRHYLTLVLATWVLGGCMAASPWKLDSISTGVERFDSARLTYSAADSPFRFEVM